MAPTLDLTRFRCPECTGALTGSTAPDGFARCGACNLDFFLRDGVFDLAPQGSAPLTLKTAAQFGASWQIHDHITDYHEKQFEDWIAPLKPVDFAGKSVIEGGCGKGRHSRAMAGWGAESLTAFDLSDAVLLAAGNTAELSNVACVRANLLRLPTADASADLAVCVGVLHHLEDPQAGLHELWRSLRPGGTLCLWVYGREGNGWIIWGLNPVRKLFTSRIPTRWLRYLAIPVAGFLFLLLRCVYGPATDNGRRYIPWLPYSAYLGYISKFPFREVENITLDQLCPSIAYYLSRDTLVEWFEKLPGVATLEFRWHNRNSWNVVARKAG